MSVIERNPGLDVGRIVAMTLVVLLHVTGSGMDGSEHVGWAVAWAHGFSSCSVDFFALLTGYLCVDRPWRAGRILGLWGQVVVLGCAVSLACGDFRPVHLLYHFCPFLSNEFWYFTSYAMLFFVIPVLNGGILSLSRRTLLTVCGALGALIVLSWASRFDVLCLNSGFSPAWLAVLYVFGAVCRLNAEALKKVRRYALPAAFAFGTLNVLYIRIARVTPSLSAYFGCKPAEYDYTSPMAVLTAVSLLTWCASIRIAGERTRKIIKTYAASAFGVYLIHTNPAFLERFWIGRFRWIGELPAAGTVAVLVLLPPLLFLAFGTLDLIRARACALLTRKGHT